MFQQLTSICAKENVFADEPMKNHTSFQIGGNADYLVLPENIEQLIEVSKAARNAGMPCFIMGNGSNLLVSDKGIRGLVVKTVKLNKVRAEANTVIAECGCSMAKFAAAACEAELTGLEFASGIPGTVGGGVLMNAGAYDGEMSFVVSECTFSDDQGQTQSLPREQLDFSYRHSFFTGKPYTILETKCILSPGNGKEIAAKMADLNQRRRDKQPLSWPSAGSTFKRPPGYFAGKLIQDAGLKGVKVGGAQVSEKHSGFIINTGGATAEDVLNLVAKCQEEVYNQFKVRIDTEIKIVGEF